MSVNTSIESRIMRVRMRRNQRFATWKSQIGSLATSLAIPAGNAKLQPPKKLQTSNPQKSHNPEEIRPRRLGLHKLRSCEAQAKSPSSWRQYRIGLTEACCFGSFWSLDSGWSLFGAWSLDFGTS